MNHEYRSSTALTIFSLHSNPHATSAGDSKTSVTIESFVTSLTMKQCCNHGLTSTNRIICIYFNINRSDLRLRPRHKKEPDVKPTKAFHSPKEA